MAFKHVIDPQMGYYRYVVFSIYATEACAVFIFFCIQLSGLYFTLRTTQIEQMTAATGSQNASGSQNSSKPAPTATEEQSRPGSPRSLSSKSSLRRMNSNSSTAGGSNSTSQKKESILVYILPLLCFSLYFLSAICAMLTVWGVPFCALYCRVGPGLYLAAKSCMYLLFVFRLYIVYCDSAFAYNSKALIVFAAFIIGYTLIIVVFNGATMGVVVYYNTFNERTCGGLMNPLSGLIIIVCDTTISFVCCYMFIKPLLVLTKFDDTDDKLYQIILKYLILTSVAVITTQFMMAVMLAIQFLSIVCIDVIINCVCLLFFSQQHHHRYKRVCCGAISVCRLIFKRKKKTKEQETDIHAL